MMQIFLKQELLQVLLHTWFGAEISVTQNSLAQSSQFLPLACWRPLDEQKDEEMDLLGPFWTDTWLCSPPARAGL